MSAFEFLFGFFGLILGIAVANVGIGFGKLWRARGKVEVGVCIPLLGVWLLSHAVLNWTGAWSNLQGIPINPTVFIISLAVALPYVVVSTVMFPDDADTYTSLDDFYLSHSRLVMVAMMIPTSAGMVGYLSGGRVYSGLALLETFVAIYMVPLVLLFWRNLWVHRIGLALASVLVIWWVY
jgi:hypothetical protein